jgi:Protein of unknown function (DUF3500)
MQLEASPRQSALLFCIRFGVPVMNKCVLLSLCTLLLLPQRSTFADHAAETEGNAAVSAVSAAMQSAAAALLATMPATPGNIETSVGYHRRELAALAFEDPARSNYVYWPYLRKGLPLDYMTAEQRGLVHDLLNTALSAKGYLAAIQVMQLEKILQDTETTGFPRGAENYSIAIFGDPQGGATWGWRFEGHHLSLNFTVTPSAVSVTPSFFGASPARIPNGVLAGFRNQRGTHEAGLALVRSLDADQRAVAIAAGDPPFDIVAGNLNKPAASWDAWKQQAPQGIAVASLTAVQKDLVQRILDDVVTIYRPELAEAYLQQIDVNNLHFVWFGGTADGDPHYYRLEGEDFWFEYDLVQSMGNHVHAVWRSKQGDFGGDLLREHHALEH